MWFVFTTFICFQMWNCDLFTGLYGTGSVFCVYVFASLSVSFDVIRRQLRHSLMLPFAQFSTFAIKRNSMPVRLWLFCEFNMRTEYGTVTWCLLS